MCALPDQGVAGRLRCGHRSRGLWDRPGRRRLTVPLEPASPGTLALLGEVLGGLPRILLHDTDFETEPRPIAEPSSPEMPEPSERPDKYQFFGEIARGGMGAVLRGRDATWAASWRSRSCSISTATSPTWCAGSWRRRRSAASFSIPGVVPSTSWVASPTSVHSSR